MDNEEHLFNCSVCLSPFSNEGNVPKVLQCGHTFCKSCLRKVHRAPSEFPCPICRRITRERSATLPTNYQLLEVLQRLEVTIPTDEETDPVDPVTARSGLNEAADIVESCAESFDNVIRTLHLASRQADRDGPYADDINFKITQMSLLFDDIQNLISTPHRPMIIRVDNADFNLEDESDDFDDPWPEVDEDWDSNNLDYDEDEEDDVEGSADDVRPATPVDDIARYISYRQFGRRTNPYCNLCGCKLPQAGERIHVDGRKHRELSNNRANQQQPQAVAVGVPVVFNAAPAFFDPEYPEDYPEFRRQENAQPVASIFGISMNDPLFLFHPLIRQIMLNQQNNQ